MGPLESHSVTLSGPMQMVRPQTFRLGERVDVPALATSRVVTFQTQSREAVVCAGQKAMPPVSPVSDAGFS